MRRTLHIGLALLLTAASSARQEDPTRALESRARYLARRPYHARVFDEFVEIAREAELLDAWRLRFEGQAAGGDEAALVLLARLAAVAGEVDAALARLDGLAAADPARDALRARLLAAAGREDEASVDYARAVAGTPRGDERAELLREQADLLVRLGRLDEARGAYAALAEERPADLLLRLDVAEACARGGLVEDALGHYRVALEVAAGDPEAESRAYFALGRLAEARNLADEAASSYRAALDGLGRGHWQRDAVFTRLLALQRRRGTLASWRDELTARLAGGLSGPLPFEDLAQVAGAMGEPEVAADLLARAAERFPADVGLARRRVALARDLGRVDEWIDLLQARVAEEGEDVALRLELADAFLEADRADASRLQWERVAELGAERPDVLADLARRRAEAGEDEPVVALLRRVVALAPRDLRGWAELARHHRAHGRADAARAELAAAEVALVGTTPAETGSARSELAELWLEQGEPERALALLEPLRSAAPEDLRLARQIAGVLVELSRGDEARAVLRPFLAAATDAGRLRTLVGAWLETFATASERTVALAVESDAAFEGGGDRASYWIAALGNARVGDPARAAELFARRMDGTGSDARLALEERVELALDAGQLDVALPLLDRLLALDPEGTYTLQVEAVSRLVAARRADDARARLADLDPGESAARLRDLATLHRRLGQSAEAIALLERAARLAEDDPRSWRELAELCRAEFRFPEALATYQKAYRFANGRRAVEVAVDLERFLDEHGRVEAEVRRLATLGEERPLEAWASLLAVDLLVAHERPFEARDLLDARIEALPFEPLFIAKRAELFARMGFTPERRADLESLRAMGVGGDVDLRLLEARLAEDPRAWVGDLTAAPESPVDVAELLLAFGRHGEARDLLERARGRRSSAELDALLADAYAGLDRPRDEAAALERLLAALDEPDRALLERLGRVQAGLGRADRALELGRQLLARSRPRALRAYFAEIGEAARLPAEACRAARANLDGGAEDLVDLGELSEDLQALPGGPETLARLLDELLGDALAAGRAPSGRSPAHFALELVERRASAADFDTARPSSWLDVAFQGGGLPSPRAWGAARDAWDGEPATGAALVKIGVRLPEVGADAARLALELAAQLERLPDRALLELEAARRRPRVDRDVASLRLPPGEVELAARCAAWIDGELRMQGAASWLEPLKLRLEAATAAHRATAPEVVDLALQGLSAAEEREPFARLLRAEAEVRGGRDAAAALARLRADLDELGVSERSAARFEDAAWGRLVRAFRESERLGEGYLFLRLAAAPGQAQRLVEEPADRAACCAQLEEQLGAVPARDLDLAVLASELRWQSDREAAVALVDRALERLRREPRLLALRARLLESVGRPDDALADWREAVRRSTTVDAAEPAIRAPIVEWEEDMHRGAWEILEASVDAAGVWRLHLLRLALVRGEEELAREQLGPLLSIDPPRDDAWLRGLLRATRLHVSTARLTEWYGALHRALPRDRTLLRTYVEALFASGRGEEALATLDEFVAGRDLPEADRAVVDYLRSLRW